MTEAPLNIKSSDVTTRSIAITTLDGQIVNGVTRIDFDPILPGEFISAKLTMLVGVEFQAMSAVSVEALNPVSGKIERVAKIEFEDGTVIDARKDIA